MNMGTLLLVLFSIALLLFFIVYTRKYAKIKSFEYLLVSSGGFLLISGAVMLYKDASLGTLMAEIGLVTFMIGLFFRTITPTEEEEEKSRRDGMTGEIIVGIIFLLLGISGILYTGALSAYSVVELFFGAGFIIHAIFWKRQGDR